MLKRGTYSIYWLWLLLWAVLLVAGCSTLFSPHVRRGDQSLKEGKWGEAMVAYKAALKADPFNDTLNEKFAVARSRTAAEYEQRASEWLKEGHVEIAVDALKYALRLEPSSPLYQASLNEALRRKEAKDLAYEGDKLRQVGRGEEAMDAYKEAASLDPDLRQALEGITALSEEHQASIRESRLTERVTLRFRNAGLKEVFEGLSRAAEISIIFDKDVRNDPVTIFLQDMPFHEALNLILTSNNLFSRKVGPDTLLISPNTRQKQEQYREQMIRTFYLSHAKAKNIVTLLKTMLSMKRVYANEQINAVVVRDQAEKLQLAERVILANDRRESEVLLDVEVLEVTRTNQEKYGLDFPKQAAFTVVPPGFTGSLTAALAQQFSLSQLRDIGGDNYVFKLPTTVVVDFLKSITDSKVLASPKLRVMNNQKAEINIGAKEPILLSTTNVVPGSTSTGSVPTTSTVTSIEFRDTGVKLSVEPFIHLGNELSLKLKIEFVRVGDKIILQESPRIESNRFGNRTTETTLHMKDGETIVIAGLIQEEDRKSKSTVPLLGDIPYLGALFTSFDTQRVTTEIVLTITPHLVQTMTLPSPTTQAFWSGTEFFYTNRPMFNPSRQGGYDQLEQESPVAYHRATPPEMAPTPEDQPTGSGGSGAEGTPRLGVDPSDVATPLGEEFIVTVSAERVRVLNEGLLTVEFDPAVLEFRGVRKGGLLDQGSVEASAAVSSDADRASVKLTWSRPGEPLSGSGELALITFAGKAPGVSPLSVEMQRIMEGESPGVAPISGKGIVRVR